MHLLVFFCVCVKCICRILNVKILLDVSHHGYTHWSRVDPYFSTIQRKGLDDTIKYFQTDFNWNLKILKCSLN